MMKSLFNFLVKIILSSDDFCLLDVVIIQDVKYI